jgi:hypothetical protein
LVSGTGFDLQHVANRLFKGWRFDRFNDHDLTGLGIEEEPHAS